jgi:hypothetical protein
MLFWRVTADRFECDGRQLPRSSRSPETTKDMEEIDRVGDAKIKRLRTKMRQEIWDLGLLD